MSLSLFVNVVRERVFEGDRACNCAKFNYIRFQILTKILPLSYCLAEPRSATSLFPLLVSFTPRFLLPRLALVLSFYFQLRYSVRLVLVYNTEDVRGHNVKSYLAAGSPKQAICIPCCAPVLNYGIIGGFFHWSWHPLLPGVSPPARQLRHVVKVSIYLSQTGQSED